MTDNLPYLKKSELKILLMVIRQTYGWVDKRTGRRKTRDRITTRQFMQKTGLSRRVVSKATQSLVEKRSESFRCRLKNPVHLNYDFAFINRYRIAFPNMNSKRGKHLVDAYPL